MGARCLDHDAVTEVMTALQVLYPWYGRGPFPPVPGSGPGSAPPGPPLPRMAQTTTKAGAINLPAKQLATHKAPPGYVPGGITYKAPPSNVSPRLPSGSSGPSFKAPPDQLPPAVGTGMASGGGDLHIGPPPTPYSVPLGPAPPIWKAPPAVPMAAAGAPDYAMRAPTGMHELVGFALQVVEDFPGPADIAASAVWWWDGTLSDSLTQLLAATGDADGAATALLLAANLMAASADAQATAFVCAWATVEAQVVGRRRPWPNTVAGGPPPANADILARRASLLEFICQRSRAAKAIVVSLSRTGIPSERLAWLLTELLLDINEARYSPWSNTPLSWKPLRSELRQRAQPSSSSISPRRQLTPKLGCSGTRCSPFRSSLSRLNGRLASTTP